MFPHISREAIIEDIRHTRSTEATADNILEGHLTPVRAFEFSYCKFFLIEGFCDVLNGNILLFF